MTINNLGPLIAPQAQLFETGKDRRVKTKALFKQVVKFEKFDPRWFILGENKGGPYCCKIEIMRFWRVLKMDPIDQKLKIPKPKNLGSRVHLAGSV